MAVDNKGGALNQAASLEIVVSITRRNGFDGPVSVSLAAPENLKLSAAPLTLSRELTQAKLVIQSASDSTVGAAAQVYVRAVATAGGEALEVEEPVALTIAKSSNK